MSTKELSRCATVRRFRREKPDMSGWWIFREDGEWDQEILIIDGAVASDSEWEDEMGLPPSEVYCENYWEGNAVSEMTDGTLTSGLWKFDRPLKDAP